MLSGKKSVPLNEVNDWLEQVLAVVPIVIGPWNDAGQVHVYGPPEAGWQTCTWMWRPAPIPEIVGVVLPLRVMVWFELAAAIAGVVPVSVVTLGVLPLLQAASAPPLNEHRSVCVAESARI